MVFGLDQLVAFMQQYGYVAFFLLAFFETTLAPIPSEVVLPFAGALVALGALNPLLLVPIVWFGNLAGNVFGYWAAYVLGIDVVLRYGKRLGFGMDSYAKAENWIKKYGVFFAFITEILPVIRSVTGPVCGAFKMSFKKFAVYTFAGFIIWASVLMYVGYVLASDWQTVGSAFTTYGTYAGIGIVAAVIVWFRKGFYGVLKGLYTGPKKPRRAKTSGR